MKGRHGFTLIELVISLAIAGVIAAGTHQGVRLVLDIRESASADRTEWLRQAQVRRQIAAWVGGAWVDPAADGPAFEGFDRVTRSGESDDALVFHTSTAGPLDPTDRRIVLQIDRDPSTPQRGLVAELWPTTGGGAPDAPEPVRIELEPAATGLDAEYLVSVNGERHVMAGWISHVALPRGVGLTIDGDSVAALLRLPVHVALQGGM